jgi:Zn-dependent protease with chaperone function
LSEAAFPLLGAAFVVCVVLPACALVAKGVLLVAERDVALGPLRGLNLRYVVLTSSSLLPLGWFLSAGVHQVESKTFSLACLFDHDAAALCLEPGFFSLLLILVMVCASLASLRTNQRVQSSTSDVAVALASRLAGVVARDPSLGDLQGRLRVTEDETFTLGVYGFAKPCVFVGVGFAARLTDEMLASALGHEQAHVRALDPVRFGVLQFALRVNPLGGWLLAPHAARWRAAREAHCDREAVVHGAAPLPLAHAIVRAARPGPHPAVALGDDDTAVLRFRIGMLLAYAERAPARCRQQGPEAFSTAFGLLLFALLLPHQAGTDALDAVHTGAERALIHFWR